MITFIKFVCVGFVNTALDLAVLNLLVFMFGTGSHNELYVVFKSTSFFVALLNSYLMNKFFVFRTSVSSGTREPVLFFMVSSVGFVLNVGTSFAVFTAITALAHVSTHLAVTFGAVAGSCVVLGWNFIGYRSFVFAPIHD